MALKITPACCAAALAVGLLAASPVLAQTPGLTGMWSLFPGDFARREAPPLTPAAAAAAEASRKATEEQGKVLSDANKKCMPNGMPGMMANEFALQFLETPGRITILSENSPVPRTVYLNRTEPSDGYIAGWNGFSVGKWEGQTLVITTTHMNDRVSHVGRGAPPSGETRIVERYHLEDGGKTLIGEMTFHDAKVLLRPWTVKHSYSRMDADSEFWEYACEVDAPGWSERFEGDPEAKLPG